MREFTKSVFSFSWAMSLFGVQQAVNLLKPSKAKEAFDSVSEAAKQQLDDMTKETFRAGDDLQKKFVDMTMGMFAGEVFNPSRVMRMTCDMTQQAAEAVGQGVRRTAANRDSGDKGSSEQAAGWGPMGASGAGASTAQHGQAQTQPPGQPKQSQGWGPMPG